MRVLVTIIAPVYWSLSHTVGDTRSGFLLTQGTFRHESQLEFATGEGHQETPVCLGLWNLVLCSPASLSSVHIPRDSACHWAELYGQRWTHVWGCPGLLFTTPPWQGSSCVSPTSPGAWMPLALCSWPA